TGLIFGIVKFAPAAVGTEVGVVGSRQKSALVMIEPPSHQGRARILEIYDRILVSVEDIVFKRLGSLVRHPRVMKSRLWMNALLIKTRKNRSRRGAAKAAVMETEPNGRHRITHRQITPVIP